MTVEREFSIPSLATVRIGELYSFQTMVEIVLDPNYKGDLNDIALTTPGSDDIYLRVTPETAHNNAELAKFMEVMTHHDYNGDGEPDCDEIIAAIDAALWQTDDIPPDFHRPANGTYSRLVMAIMPPEPKRHIVYSFGELRPRFRWYHHLAALPMLALFIGLLQLQFAALPFTKYSVISGSFAILDMLDTWWMVAIAIAIVVLLLNVGKREPQGSPFSPHTYGFFNKAAVLEEQQFREGAENWTFGGRLRSCVAFGAIHMVNLIYPLASILPLAIGGGLLTYIYLRTYRRTHSRRAAVLEASVWHRVYNRLAIAALLISLTILIGLELLALVAAAGLLLGYKSLEKRRTQQYMQYSAAPAASK